MLAGGAGSEIHERSIGNNSDQCHCLVPVGSSGNPGDVEIILVMK